MNQSDQLAREERAAASTVDLGATRWVLIAAVVVYLIALFLPFAGGVPGWQILTFTDAAAEVQTKLTEYVFTVMSFIGLAVLTTLVLATRRFPFAAAGWMFTTVSFLVSILAIWLRRTSTAYDLGYHHGPASTWLFWPPASRCSPTFRSCCGTPTARLRSRSAASRSTSVMTSPAHKPPPPARP